MATLRRADERSRRQPIKKAISPPPPGVHRPRATIRRMTRPSFARVPARPLALLGCLVLVSAACGPTTTSPSPAPTASPPSATASAGPTGPAAPSASPAGDVDATYDAIEEQVLAIRSLA